MKQASGVFGVFLILAAIVMWISWGIGSFQLKRDTVSVLERAQVAANAEDMYEYMSQLQENMEEREMVEGHAAWIFQTPENDMSLIYKTVTRIKERLSAIKNLPQDNTTYQVALDDLRGTARELNLFASDWFSTSNWIWTRFGSFFAFIVGLALLINATLDS